MDVRHLELLRELADRGTITAVAEATYRTPSAVSQQLRSAEREFGVSLVIPEGRRLRLTQAGRLLAEGAVDISAALARLQSDLDQLRDAPHGTIRVGGLPSAAEALVPRLITRLAKAQADIMIELNDFDIAEADFAGRVSDHHIVLGHTLAAGTPPGATELHWIEVATEPLDVAVPAAHHLADAAELTPRDVVAEPWIAVPEGYPFDTVLIAIENLTGCRIARLQRLRDNRVVQALVAEGIGLAILPRFTTRPSPGVVTKPLVGVGAARHLVALARRDTAERLAVRTVLRHLAEVGADLEHAHS